MKTRKARPPPADARRTAARAACAPALAAALLSGCAAWQPPRDAVPPAPVVVAQPGGRAPAARPGGPVVPPVLPPRIAAPPARPPAVPAPRPAPPPPRLAALPAPAPAPVPAPAPAVLSFREVLALQVLLDRQGFSCNCIDGKLGPLTRQALAAWQAREGLAPTGEPDAAAWERLGPAEGTLTTHVVAAEELASLAPVPATWAAKAQAPALACETMLEWLAERYRASEAALRALNPGAAWPDPPAGTALVVPAVDAAAAPPPRAARVEIALAAKTVRVFDAGERVVALFPCSIARDREKRPVGELRVAVAARDPNYTFDPALFAEDPESATIGGKLIVPPGPNNPVGVAWIGLDRPGYGIHGTPRPEDIGKTQSHGCFRLANWNARRLLRMAWIGLPVTVVE